MIPDISNTIKKNTRDRKVKKERTTVLIHFKSEKKKRNEKEERKLRNRGTTKIS
jgi:hypothetical protein